MFTSRRSKEPLKELLFLPVIYEFAEPADAIVAPAAPKVPPITEGRC